LIKIISWNVNGIRACVNKGFLDFLKEADPDICCIQETKVQEDQLPEEVLQPSGYSAIWHSAQKKGYSGVATFTKIKPKNVIEGMGIEKYDLEGRVIQTDFSDFTLFNVYFPNGQMNEERLRYKLDFYRDFFEYCEDLRKMKRSLIITGDYNTAHKEIDLANPKENANYSGFLPVERAWMDKIIAMGYVDVFREFDKSPNQYTWWTYRYGARAKNIGWRIDYFFVTNELLPKIKSIKILKDVLGSDHCPVELEILHS
jgi:exodeoxyribonuclease-3